MHSLQPLHAKCAAAHQRHHMDMLADELDFYARTKGVNPMPYLVFLFTFTLVLCWLASTKGSRL